MNSLPDNATLIVIDVQKAFEHPKWGQRNNPSAEANVGRLLEGWRFTGRPIVHVRHRNNLPGLLFSPGEPGFEAKPEARALVGETVIYKSVNSAFIGTDLEKRLREAEATHLVLCGITTDHCVSTTTRMAGNLGFAAYVAADATATFDRIGPDGRHWTAAEMYATALASLNEEFAFVADTAKVLELL